MVASSNTANAKTPAGLAGVLSIVPGLGQVSNGDFLEGLGWFASTVVLYKVQPYVAFDLHMYNMYDAYRDAKPSNGRYTNYSLFENYIGVFNPLNALDLVGGPLLTFYGVVPGLAYYKGQNLYPLKAISTSFIGPAEEGLFRGFLFPAFSSAVSSKLGGALISSILFGLVHTQYDPKNQMVVGLYGLVQCVIADLNKYDLRKGMFSHSWTDFFLLPKGVGPLENAPSSETLNQDGTAKSQSVIARGITFGWRIKF